MTLTILYVGGVGRSGSSMIERLLDQYEDVTSLGEIHQIFSHWINFDKRQLCGCGEEFQACGFWRNVIGNSLGSMDDFDPVEWSKKRADILGDQRRMELLFDRGSPEYFDQLNAFMDEIGSVYKSIAKESGAKVIVDSSKTALWAVALQRVPGIEVRFLHFVRNPYATAFSWQRKKRLPEIWWEERYMPQFTAKEIAKRWRATFVTSLLAARKVAKYKRVHYEDFVKDPAAMLRDIETFAGIPPENGQGVLKGRTAHLAPGHTVMGNPMRVSKEITIKNDDQWRDTFPKEEKRQMLKYLWPLRPFFRG